MLRASLAGLRPLTRHSIYSTGFILRATPPAAGPLRYGPTEAPRWSQRGTKMVPKRHQDGPKDAPKLSQRCPNMAPKDAPGWPKMAPRGPKMASGGPKMAPSGPKMAPAQTWEQFWLHFGFILGLLLASKSSPKLSLILPQFLMPCWDQIWNHFGIKIGPIWVSCGVCAESPATTSPRDGFSLFF